MVAKASTRTSFIGLIGLVLVIASFANAAPAAAATTTTEARLFRWVNSAREYHGIRALRMSDSLSTLARRHSAKMAAAGDIFHTSSLSSALRYYSWRVAGENVGMSPSIWTMYLAFMRSPSHRENILDRSYRSTGIGCVWKYHEVYCTQEFIG